MDPLTLDRWTELQFYYICSDILSLRNNIMDLMDMIDNLALFGNYSPEQLKPLAHEILASLRYRPSKEEFCILCHLFKVPTMDVKRRLNIHNRTYYDIIKKHQEDPRLFYPRFQKPQLNLISTFVNTFNQFRNIGVYQLPPKSKEVIL